MFKGIPGTTITDKDKGTVIAEIGMNGFASASLKKQLSGKNIEATKDGYEPKSYHMETKIQGTYWVNFLNGILGFGIDALTGKMKTYEDDVVELILNPTKKVEQEEQIVNQNIAFKQNSNDIENIILRWHFDSDPRGARIFYRVISNIPDEVKNTNESYLTTTPLEETKSFNIKGLTYKNSRDVTIEIKVSKRGYEDQVKRFNVRQALDQQDISGFFELVPKEAN